MSRLLSKELYSVNTYLRRNGFSCLKSDPTDEQAKQFIQVMVWTNRADLKFKPYVDLVYEKKISTLSSYIVEGKPIKNRYYYDFYLARYDWRSGDLLYTKNFCSGVTNYELMYHLKKMFSSDKKP